MDEDDARPDAIAANLLEVVAKIQSMYKTAKIEGVSYGDIH